MAGGHKVDSLKCGEALNQGFRVGSRLRLCGRGPKVDSLKCGEALIQGFRVGSRLRLCGEAPRVDSLKMRRGSKSRTESLGFA